MVEIKQNLVSKDKYGIKCPYTMKPKYVVIHNTANDAAAANEISYMRSNNNEVSFHYAVDDKEIVQGITEDRNAWHAGDGSKGEGNRYGIAIEICYSKSGGAKFDAAEKNAAEFAASILKRYGWGIDRLKTHKDFNGKNCPHRTLALGWQRFVDMVAAHLERKAPESEKETGTANGLKVGDVVYFKGSTHYKSADAKTGIKCAAGWAKITATAKGAHPYHLVRTGKSGPYGWVDADEIATVCNVRVKIKDLYIRKGAGTNYATNGFVKPGLYTITEEKSGKGSVKGWGKLNSGAGWISLDYAEKV